MARLVLSRCALAAAVITECPDSKPCRRTELPIYVQEAEKEVKRVKQTEQDNRVAKSIEETVGTVRKSVMSIIEEFKKYEKRGVQFVNDGVDQAQWLVTYLGEDDNPAPKGPAIAIGGLTGFIFAVRGGVFRKIVFTTAGALAMAAVCFPKEASEYSKMAIQESRQYATIAYNFAYGAKKDDPPLELPSLPKIPGSISEAWSLVSSIGKSSQPSVSENDVVGLDSFDGDKTHATSLKLQDPKGVISDALEDATKKQCHCPLGACLNPHAGDTDTHPSVLPYPPPLSPNQPVCPPCPEM